MLTNSLMNELSLYKGQEFKPVERKALVLMCADYRGGHEGPNKMKNPPKELLYNEMTSYMTMLKRIGFEDKEITFFEEPQSKDLDKYLKQEVLDRAMKLSKAGVDEYGR